VGGHGVRPALGIKGSGSGGLLLGSSAVADRVRRPLGEKPEDLGAPRLGAPAPPAMEAIMPALAAYFDVDAADWVPAPEQQPRGPGGGRLPGRRRFDYDATAVAAALGYRDHAGQAIRRTRHGRTGADRQTLGEKATYLVRRPASPRVGNTPASELARALQSDSSENKM